MQVIEEEEEAIPMEWNVVKIQRHSGQAGRQASDI